MNIFLSVILTLLLFIIGKPSLSEELSNFDYHLENWNKNIELASQYLKDAEKELKNGDELQGCINQRKAAKYGIEATESLIKAFEVNGSTEDITNIKAGLNKWKELRDFC